MWSKSKALGSAAELRLYDWLRLTYPRARQLHGHDLIDIEIPELRNLAVEVKFDDVSTRTGKVAFEFSCRDLPSGISNSDADVWVIFTGSDVLAMSTKRLRAYIAEAKPEIKSGGDKGQTKMYLVRKRVLMAQQFVFKLDLSKPPILKAA